jgi:protein-S-isoprenylcysteine O-methyltransferase Ste14
VFVSCVRVSWRVSRWRVSLQPLSDQFIREDHQLIANDINYFMRHPMYLGFTLVALGIPVYTASLEGILIMLALTPILLIRQLSNLQTKMN